MGAKGSEAAGLYGFGQSASTVGMNKSICATAMIIISNVHILRGDVFIILYSRQQLNKLPRLCKLMKYNFTFQ